MTQPVQTSKQTGAQPLQLPGSSDVQVTDWFASQLWAALQNPLLYIPKVFETWMSDRVAVAGLDIPISQIVGFTQFTATDSGFDSTIGAESTTSTTYVDLTTSGPKISGLADGSYLILFGCQPQNATTGDSAVMSLSINGAAASDDYVLSANAVTSAAYPAGAASCARAVAKTLLNGGNNTVTAKYRSVLGGTATFGRRWMIALKTANA